MWSWHMWVSAWVKCGTDLVSVDMMNVRLHTEAHTFIDNDAGQGTLPSDCN